MLHVLFVLLVGDIVNQLLQLLVEFMQLRSVSITRKKLDAVFQLQHFLPCLQKTLVPARCPFVQPHLLGHLLLPPALLLSLQHCLSLLLHDLRALLHQPPLLVVQKEVCLATSARPPFWVSALVRDTPLELQLLFHHPVTPLPCHRSNSPHSLRLLILFTPHELFLLRLAEYPPCFSSVL